MDATGESGQARRSDSRDRRPPPASIALHVARLPISRISVNNVSAWDSPRWCSAPGGAARGIAKTQHIELGTIIERFEIRTRSGGTLIFARRLKNSMPDRASLERPADISGRRSGQHFSY